MISGFEIGHYTADRDGWLTGTTVVLARAGAVGGVDVRGGGPGTRETDLLNPTTLVQQAHAVVLTGGSAYGLAAADGVMLGLEEQQIGFQIGPSPEQVVPIVPAAVIFDLGRGGEYRNRPDASFGARALAAASTADPEQGCVGAGTGAKCGGLKGGFGYATRTIASESGEGDVSIAAAVVVNAAGSVVDPLTGRLYADRTHRLQTPTDSERAALAAAQATAPRSLNTTIGVIMTDATLTKPQANKVSQVGHDGMARAISPLHLMTDGDTVFALASAQVSAPTDPVIQLAAFNQLLIEAADVFTEACLNAVLSATDRGELHSYATLAPSALGREPRSSSS